MKATRFCQKEEVAVKTRLAVLPEVPGTTTTIAPEACPVCPDYTVADSSAPGTAEETTADDSAHIMERLDTLAAEDHTVGGVLGSLLLVSVVFNVVLGALSRRLWNAQKKDLRTDNGLEMTARRPLKKEEGKVEGIAEGETLWV